MSKANFATPSKEVEHSSAFELLDRQVGQDYIAEWTELLQNEQAGTEEAHENSVVIFRLHQEWLALSTHSISEVAEMRTIHSIPHRSGTILMGVVNLRGQLHLCVALDQLLEIEADAAEADAVEHTATAYRRLMQIRRRDERWIFPVEEIYGIYRFDMKALQNVPVTVAKSTANFFKGVFIWNNKSVGFLDDELLLSSLKRSAL